MLFNWKGEEMTKSGSIYWNKLEINALLMPLLNMGLASTTGKGGALSSTAVKDGSEYDIR